MEQERVRERRGEADLAGAAEEFVGGVARLGYGLLSLPLALLPRQTRAHVHSAVRELSHGFARLPAEFAAIAGAEIERWAAEGEDGPAPPRPAPPAQRPPAAAPVAPTAPAPVAAAVAAPPAAVSAVAEPPLAPADLLPEPSPLETSLLSQVEVVVSKESLSPVGIAYIEYDPPGDDVAGEYVTIRNSGDTPAELAGWRLSDSGSRHTFVFPPFTLAPGAEVKVWTKAGVSDAGNLYWGSTRPIWNNSGDDGALADASGATVSSYSYGGEGGDR